jgi:hypothetical protein
MAYPFLMQGSNIVVVIGNQPHTISKSHPTYEKVKEAIKAGDWDLVKDIIEPKKVVLKYGRGNVSIEGEKLFWKGTELHSALASRMIQMMQDGFTIEPMVNFMENLMTNPSYRSVQELYGFLEKNNLPITPDGYFLAYKKVRQNYFDVHSGTMDNSVGKTVEMERNLVDDNQNNTCSAGLHFCSQSYLSHFGGERVVIVKINPADVVSIPTDYNNAKGRACRYEVIGEVGASDEDTTAAFDKSVQDNAVGNIAAPVAKPVAVAKRGSSEFYEGYSDGFNDLEYSGRGKNYAEGYAKGAGDVEDGKPARYVYDATAPLVPSKANDAAASITLNPAWPYKG